MYPVRRATAVVGVLWHIRLTPMQVPLPVPLPTAWGLGEVGWGFDDGTA